MCPAEIDAVYASSTVYAMTKQWPPAAVERVVLKPFLSGATFCVQRADYARLRQSLVFEGCAAYAACVAYAACAVACLSMCIQGLGRHLIGRRGWITAEILVNSGAQWCVIGASVIMRNDVAEGGFDSG